MGLGFSCRVSGARFQVCLLKVSSSGFRVRISSGGLAADTSSSCSWRLLGGSWVVISRAISPLIWVITIVTLIMMHWLRMAADVARTSQETLKP